MKLFSLIFKSRVCLCFERQPAYVGLQLLLMYNMFAGLWLGRNTDLALSCYDMIVDILIFLLPNRNFLSIGISFIFTYHYFIFYGRLSQADKRILFSQCHSYFNFICRHIMLLEQKCSKWRTNESLRMKKWEVNVGQIHGWIFVFCNLVNGVFVWGVLFQNASMSATNKAIRRHTGFIHHKVPN